MERQVFMTREVRLRSGETMSSPPLDTKRPRELLESATTLSRALPAGAALCPATNDSATRLRMDRRIPRAHTIAAWGGLRGKPSRYPRCFHPVWLRASFTSLNRSMRLRNSNILATLVCVLLQVGGATVAHGLVLCVADDGHVAVELSHVATRCAADYRRHHPEPLSEMGSDLDPHACTDTVLGSTPAWRHADLASSMASRPIAVRAILSSRQTDRATLVARARASADGNGPFDCRIGHLRSVVLVA